MDQIEASIRNAILRKENPDFETRSKIYKSALSVLDNFSEADQIAIRQRLIEVVRQIEDEYERLQPRYSETDEDNTSFAAPPDPDLEAVSFQDSIPEESLTPKKPRFPLWAKLAIVLGVGIAFIWVVASSWINQTQPVSAPEPASETQSESQSDAPQNTSNLFFEIDLPKDADQLAENAIGRNRSENPFGKFIDGSEFLAVEDLSFFSKELLPVDTSKIYLMRVTMRVKKMNSKWPRIQAGFATFDADENVQRDPPGSHRYFVHLGLFRPDNVLAVGDEFSISGVISGEGNTAHDMMRPGTKFVRPLVFIRADDKTNVLEVKRVEVLAVN